MLTLGIIRMTSLRLGQKKKKKITYFDIIAGSTLENDGLSAGLQRKAEYYT